MAIEKLALVDIDGSPKRVNKTLIKCCESGCFHMNPPPNISDSQIVAKNLRDRGLYQKMIKRCETIADALGITLDGNAPYDEIEYNVSIDFKSYLDELDSKYSELTEKLAKLNSELKSSSAIYKNLIQFSDFNADFNEFFACEYIKIRFGRIPNGSIKKLGFYKNRSFLFYPFETEQNYTWCLYVSSISELNETDFLFKTLGFERTILPRYLVGTPEEASNALRNEMQSLSDSIGSVERDIKAIAEAEGDKLTKVYSKLIALDNSYELRTNVLVFDNRFHFSGYVPKKDVDRFIKEVGSVEDVNITVQDADDDNEEKPVKLKNLWLFRPFEMFVKMYGLPASDGIDPTPLVAITYMLLYGIMFGDLGQGLCIFLLGLIMTKLTKVKLAPIMTRIGLSSAFFGIIYGSVFGNEEIIKPFFHIPEIYELLGYKEAPENIFDVATILLIFALIIGIVLVLLSMIINTVISLKNKDIETGIFGPSGLLGIIFYGSLVLGLGSSFAFGVDIMSPLYIIFLIVLPLVLMFFKEPLVKALSAKRRAEKAGRTLDKGLRARIEAMFKDEEGEEKKSVGNFIIEGFIDLFETCLTYLTNTMSFLRIGGFILSHAGLMLVFHVVGNLAGEGVGFIIVQIVGNIFVTGFEGFLVGIQVLRLEFYELFSRFFKGGGKPFDPVTINQKS